MATPDPDVLKLLTDMEFQRDDIGPYRAFTNRPGWGRPQTLVAFTRRYETIAAAQRAHILLKLYAYGTEKGTLAHPTEDRLTRAYRSLRCENPDVSLRRQEEQLTLFIEAQYPADSTEGTTTERVARLVREQWTAPRILTDPALFERVRRERQEAIDERIQDHELMLKYHFRQTFLQKQHPIDEQQERELLRTARVDELAHAYAEHCEDSHVSILYAGNRDIASVGVSLEPLLAQTPTPRSEDVLTVPRTRPLAIKDGPVHVEGPSEQLQHYRAYPLSAVTNDPTERVALKLGLDAIGGGWTARLMRVIREQHHLVYGIGGQFNHTFNTYRVQTEHEPAVRERIGALCDGILHDAADGQVTDAEIDDQREQRIQGFLISSTGEDFEDCTQPKARLNDARRVHIQHTCEHTPAQAYLTLVNTTPDTVRHALRTHLQPLRCQEFTYGRRDA